MTTSFEALLAEVEGRADARLSTIESAMESILARLPPSAPTPTKPMPAPGSAALSLSLDDRGALAGRSGPWSSRVCAGRPPALPLARHVSEGQGARQTKHGTLTVHVKWARNLIKADVNGYSDPYALATVAGQAVARSKTIKRTLNPDWDQKLEFAGVLEDLTAEPLCIEVYDQDFGISALVKSRVRFGISALDAISPNMRAPRSFSRQGRADRKSNPGAGERKSSPTKAFANEPSSEVDSNNGSPSFERSRRPSAERKSRPSALAGYKMSAGDDFLGLLSCDLARLLEEDVNTLELPDVPLEGVRSGTVTFSVTWAAFDGEANALQMALEHDPQLRGTLRDIRRELDANFEVSGHGRRIASLVRQSSIRLARQSSDLRARMASQRMASKRRGANGAGANGNPTLGRGELLRLWLRHARHRLFSLLCGRVLDPGSSFRTKWNLVLAVMILYCGIQVPLEIAFEADMVKSMCETRNALETFTKQRAECVPFLTWFWYNFLVDLWFIADIIVNLRTGYMREGFLVKDDWLAAKHYLKGSFVFDVLGSFPLNIVVMILQPDNMYGDITEVRGRHLVHARVQPCAASHACALHMRTFSECAHGPCASCPACLSTPYHLTTTRHHQHHRSPSPLTPAS